MACARKYRRPYDMVMVADAEYTFELLSMYTGMDLLRCPLSSNLLTIYRRPLERTSHSLVYPPTLRAALLGRICRVSTTCQYQTTALTNNIANSGTGSPTGKNGSFWASDTSNFIFPSGTLGPHGGVTRCDQPRTILVMRVILHQMFK